MYGDGVAVDGSGNEVVGGTINGTADFGGGPQKATGNEDIFLAKWTAAGGYVWGKHFGVANKDCFFRQAAFDSAGICSSSANLVGMRSTSVAGRWQRARACCASSMLASLPWSRASAAHRDETSPSAAR